MKMQSPGIQKAHTKNSVMNIAAHGIIYGEERSSYKFCSVGLITKYVKNKQP